MLKEMSYAPNFALENQNGELVRLSDFSGKPLVLYFYPKDNTPGCTKEACSFRDDYSEYEKMSISIVGISPDSTVSHKNFQDKYSLPFTLLSDPGHQVASEYGVWGKKKRGGKEYEGIYRTTFIINGEGVITKVFEGVNPSDHGREVLAEVKKLF